MEPTDVKFDTKKMDLDVLDELIGKCEDSMVHPFKKDKAVAIEIEPEEGGGEEAAPEEHDKPDLSDMDLEDLIEAWQAIKGEG